jgi:hypothetical protein
MQLPSVTVAVLGCALVTGGSWQLGEHASTPASMTVSRPASMTASSDAAPSGEASGRLAEATAAGEQLSVTIPDRATAATDGLPRTLSPGQYRISLPVWRAAGTTRIAAALQIDGHTCASAEVDPGAVAHLTCRLTPRPGGSTVVSVVAGGRVLGRWQHQGLA